MFRDFAQKMDPCLGIFWKFSGLALRAQKIFVILTKNGPMFRDLGVKNDTHVLGFFCQKPTHLGGTSPYSVSMEVPPGIRNQVQITLNIDIISRITNDYDVLWRKLWSKWVELVGVKRCTCLFTNTLKMFTRRITSLILFRRRNYLQFFTFWIFFNPTNYANLYLTIYSYILECLQYQNHGLRRNKRDLFTITVQGFVGYFIV